LTVAGLLLYGQTSVGINTLQAYPGVPSGACGDNSIGLNQTNGDMYSCNGGEWWKIGPTTTGGLPEGLIVATLSASCPAGFTESAEFDGVTVIGTVAANMDVGDTGGVDAITPTVDSLSAAAQVFTGSALGTHAHTGGTYSAAAQVFTGTLSTAVVNHVHTLATGTGSTGNFAQVIGTVDSSSGGTGATPTQTTLGTRSVATVGGVASYTPAGTNAASAVTGTGQAVSGGTPAGTNGISAVTGTLNQFDNRSAFIKVIFCVKD